MSADPSLLQAIKSKCGPVTLYDEPVMELCPRWPERRPNSDRFIRDMRVVAQAVADLAAEGQYDQDVFDVLLFDVMRQHGMPQPKWEHYRKRVIAERRQRQVVADVVMTMESQWRQDALRDAAAEQMRGQQRARRQSALRYQLTYDHSQLGDHPEDVVHNELQIHVPPSRAV